MPETVGQRLRIAREEKKLTLEIAASATRLRAHHLQALENDDYSVMASAAQGRGFLRLYAEYLGLNLDQIIKDVSASMSATLEPAPSAPEAGQAVEPILATPNPTSDMDSSRPGFWSRLLRRGAAAESTSAPEAMVIPAAPALEQPAQVIEPSTATLSAEDPQAPTVRKARAGTPRGETKAKTSAELNDGEPQASPAKKKRNLNP